MSYRELSAIAGVLSVGCLVPLVVVPQLLDPRVASPVDNIAFPPIGLALAQGAILLTSALLAWWRPDWVSRASQRVLGLSPARFLGAAILFVLVVTNAISYFVLDHFPHDVDDFARLFQARTLASGRLSVPAPPEAEAFQIPHVVVYHGRMFARYEPGTALLYAVWWAVFGVFWGLNPVLGASVVALTYWTLRSWHGEGVARATACFLCLSPFFILMSSGFQSHLPTLFFLAFFLLCLTRAHDRGARRSLVGAGVALGLALATRPYSAVLISAPFVLWYLATTGRVQEAARKAFVLALGLALPIAAFLVYNAALTGHPFHLPTRLIPGSEIGFTSGHTPWRAVRNTAVMLEVLNINLLGWPIGLLFPALFVVLGRKNTWDRLSIAAVASLMVGHALYYWVDFSFGPRYYFEATTLLMALTVRGLGDVTASLSRLGGWTIDRSRLHAIGGYVTLLSFLFSATIYLGPLLAKFGDHYGGIVDTKVAMLAARQGISNALVIIPGNAKVYQSGFLANSLDFGTDIVYARDRGSILNQRTIEAYPKRSVFLFEFDQVTGGRFVPYRGSTREVGGQTHGG